MSGPFDGIDLEDIDLTKLDQADVAKLFAMVPEDTVAKVVARLREAAAKEQSNRAALAEVVAIVSRVGGVVLRIAAVG